MIVASAPAKVILFGEHAVVYGQPAIAVPVSSLRATATVESNSPGEKGLRIIAVDLNEVLPIDLESSIVDNALAITARLVLQRLHTPPPDVTIQLESHIPMASGLGSGAAVSTALARALSAVVQQPLDEAALNHLIYEVEKMHHGTPSGIDNTVVVYERPVYFIRNHPVETIRIATPFTLLIADTGHTALTRIAVGGVRKLYEADPVAVDRLLQQIGDITVQARQLIESGSLSELGVLMNRNHELLQRLTVSSAELDRLVEVALETGALGAKLSGGGRGGNMIALVGPDIAEQVKESLRGAGAVRIFETTVG